MRPADWQLPPGVNRGLWDYLHDADLAKNYDAGLADSSLFHVDQDFVLRHCPLPGRLIDLGCGTGRLLIPFAQRGYHVLGVDLSAEMLQVAADKARRAQASVDLLQANLTQLDAITDASFDYAACLFSTLGMVLGAENRRAVVAHAFRILRPGGRLILHVHNRWFNVWHAAGRRWLLRGGSHRGDRVMPVHQGIAGLTLHLFTRREAVHLLKHAGFSVTLVQPISLQPDGKLRCPRWMGWLRAYGYLLVADRPCR